MPGPSNTLLIEGSFEELADELAQYLDTLRNNQGNGPSTLQTDIAQLLRDDKKEDVLKKVVTASPALNAAPEKEFVAAYNLVVHLIRQTDNISMFLPKVCQNVSAPVTSSPANGPGLALSILGTIFNMLPHDDETRYHVLLAILRVIRGSSPPHFEALKPQLRHLDRWLAAWDADDDEQRRLYLALADVAGESGDADAGYEYLIRAARTIPPDEAGGADARALALRALKAALAHPSRFDFQDLTSLDAVQALRASDPDHFELLEIFTSQLLDDFNDFKDEHDGWVQNEGLDGPALDRKMRLLTLASLSATAAQARGGSGGGGDGDGGSGSGGGAAEGGARSLPYAHIAKALQVPAEDVEMWVIDVIRAGLVEGKLSQSNRTFLIHRATYRVFGENQWREVAARLDLWRNSLLDVLHVVRQEKEAFIVQKEQELREMENKLNGTAGMGHGRRPRAAEVDVE